MRTFISIFLFALLFISCDRNSCEKTMECDGACLFNKVELAANMTYMSCFDTWGVSYVNEEDILVVGLVPDLKSSFEEENLPVMFSASFYANDIPLQFPDPGFFGEVYRADVCSLEKLD